MIVKKGYILLYVLIIGALCMTILTYCFTLEVKRMKNVISQKNYIIANSKHDEYKEKLLTKLYKEITDNVELITVDNIRSYFQNNVINYYSENKKGSVKYNKDNDIIILDTVVDDYSYRRDIYNYTAQEEKLKIIYFQTIYLEGRME